MHKKKKINFPTKTVLSYLKDTSKNLLDLSVNIFFDPDALIRNAGFYVKYPSFPSLLEKWLSNTKNNSPTASLAYTGNKIYLTDSGRIKIIKSIIKDKNKRSSWDGKWRAIVFDIPELNRKERRFLRTELKQLEFKELQHSVWVCPFNIEQELSALLKLWKIDFKGDIRFLKIEKIVDDKDIKKYFKL